MKKIKIILSCVLALWATALSAQTHFNCDIHKYQYDMTVYFQLVNAGEVVENTDDYEVAAFVGSGCRGIGEFLTQDIDGKPVKYGYLRVRSNETKGETVTFWYYNKKDKKEKVVRDVSVEFDSNPDVVIGTPSAPLSLDITNLPGDANEDGKVDATDIVDFVNYLTGKASSTGKFNKEAADMNEDGNVDTADIVMIVNEILKED